MKKYQAIIPWAIITVGLVVRLWNISALPGWYDESYTLLVARLPLASLLVAVAGDVHPPFYYLLISGLTHSIPAPAQLLCLRLFSVACGLAVLALAWNVSGLLSLARPARLVGLGLLTFHPVAIYYSQEGRMYALLMLLVLCQCWALLKQKWWLLGVATILTIYTHNYGLFYSAIIGGVGLAWLAMQPIPVYVAGQDNVLSGPAGKLILAMGVPAVLFLPWAWVLASQMGQLASHDYWLPAINFGSVISMVHRAFMGSYQLAEYWKIISVPVLVVAMVLMIKSTRRWVGLWALVVGPIVLALAISAVWKPVLLFRGLTPSLPSLAMLAGVAFTQASTRPGQAGRWVLVVPIMVGTLTQLGAGYVIQSKSGLYWPPDINLSGVVVHLEDTSYITLRAQYPATENYLLAAGCTEQPGGLSDLARKGLGVKIITPGQLPEHYSLAAVVGPLSTVCHEKIYTQLTAGLAWPVVKYSDNFGVYGIWKK